MTLGVLVALTGADARAQHGTAPPGAYPRLYKGDTWTGYVTHTDAKTRQFTLTVVQGGKAEQFVGVLRGDYKVKTQEGVHELTVSDFPMGLRLRAFYTPLKRGRGEERSDYNSVFRVDYLPDESQTFTGVVVSADDASRRLQLRPEGTGEPFEGYLIEGYHVKMRGGRMHPLLVSEIPPGTRITVLYHFDEVKLDGKTTRIARIHRIEFGASAGAPDGPPLARCLRPPVPGTQLRRENALPGCAPALE